MPRRVLAAVLAALAAAATARGARVGAHDALEVEAPRRRKTTTTTPPPPPTRSGKGGAKAAPTPAPPPPPAPAPRSGKGGQKVEVTTTPPPAPPRSGKGGQQVQKPAPSAEPSAEEVLGQLKDMRDRVRTKREKAVTTNLEPEFKKAAAKVVELEEFKRAKVVRVHLNARTYDIRLAALKAGKKLLVAVSGLNGLRLVDGAKIKKSKLADAATAKYIRESGEELDVDARIRVDLFVIASMAVNPATGCRVGPPGYSEELEYGLLRQMRAVGPRTPVVTVVEPYALVKGMEVDGALCSRVSADIIVTPSRATKVEKTSPKLKGVDFDRVGGYKISKMRLLRRLRAKLAGKTPVAPKKAAPAPAPAPAARSGKGGRTTR